MNKSPPVAGFTQKRRCGHTHYDPDRNCQWCRKIEWNGKNHSKTFIEKTKKLREYLNNAPPWVHRFIGMCEVD